MSLCQMQARARAFEMVDSAPGRCTLTATSWPVSRTRAQYTCARRACRRSAHAKRLRGGPGGTRRADIEMPQGLRPSKHPGHARQRARGISTTRCTHAPATQTLRRTVLTDQNPRTLCPCDPARPVHLRKRGGRDRALPKLGKHRVQRPPQLGLQHAPRLGRPERRNACEEVLHTAWLDSAWRQTGLKHSAALAGSKLTGKSRPGVAARRGAPSCNLASSAITGGGSTSGRIDSTCERRASVAAEAITGERMRHALPHLFLSFLGPNSKPTFFGWD